MMTIKEGDKVKVTNWGREFSTSVDWFIDNADIPRSLVARYAFGDDMHFRNCRFNDTSTYTVEYLNNARALISEAGYGPTRVYMIHVDGLKLANVKQMTVSEIEEKLGYSIEIVAENEE